MDGVEDRSAAMVQVQGLWVFCCGELDEIIHVDLHDVEKFASAPGERQI